jgi:hypothetical protein
MCARIVVSSSYLVRGVWILAAVTFFRETPILTNNHLYVIEGFPSTSRGQTLTPGTFLYRPKKRGPPNQYLRKLQEDGHSSSPQLPTVPSPRQADFLGADSSIGTPAARRSGDEGGSAGRPLVSSTNPNRQEVSSPYVASSSWYRSGRPVDTGGPGPGTLAEQRAAHATALSEQGVYARALAGREHGLDVEKEWEPHLLSALHATAARRSQEDRTVEAATLDPSAQPPFYYDTPGTHRSVSEARSPMVNLPFTSHTRLAPSFDYTSPLPRSSISPQQPITPRPQNPFDEVLPRQLLHLIIDLYFDYVYGLVPIIHRPTFMRDLHDYKEEQTGEATVDEWKALVMGLVAFTLVQIPRSFVPIKRKEVKGLIEATFAISREWLDRPPAALTVNRCE